MVFGAYRQGSNFKSLRPWHPCIHSQVANKSHEIRRAKTRTVGASVTNCIVDMHLGSKYHEWLMVFGAYRQSSNLKSLRPWIPCIHSQHGKQVSRNSGGQNDNSRCIRGKLYYRHAFREQVLQVVDGNWCISPKFKPQIIKTVASMYIYAAGKHVSGNSAGLNVKSRCIIDKLCRGHALREQVPRVVDGIWCISPKFKPQLIKTMASMYISAAGKQVSGNSAGQNENSRCIYD